MPVVRRTRNEFAPVEQDEQGRTFLDVPDPPNKADLCRGAHRYRAGDGETVFSVAWKFYRETLNREQDFRPTSLFDAIALANDIVNINEPLPVNKTLFIPTLDAIFSSLRIPPVFYRRNTVT